MGACDLSSNLSGPISPFNAGVPKWSKGVDLRSTGLVPSSVRIRSPAYPITRCSDGLESRTDSGICF